MVAINKNNGTNWNGHEDPVGVNEIANLLNVETTTVSSWRQRHVMPKPDKMINKGKTPIWKTTSLVIPYKNNVKLFTFKRGDTLSHAFSSIGLSEREVFGFINKLKTEFDPRKLKIGNKINIIAFFGSRISIIGPPKTSPITENTPKNKYPVPSISSVQSFSLNIKIW